VGEFDGRAALVTGGGKGIGRASALAFAGRGAAVTVVDLDEGAGAATVKAIQADDGQALYIRADVTQAAEVEATVARAVEQWGRLDFAHNNAGITGAWGYTADYDEADWDRVIAINLKSVFLSMKYELPHLVKPVSYTHLTLPTICSV